VLSLLVKLSDVGVILSLFSSISFHIHMFWLFGLSLRQLTSNMISHRHDSWDAHDDPKSIVF
jgi:uncharacterized membrane protein YbaN (DUF454 family)